MDQLPGFSAGASAPERRSAQKDDCTEDVVSLCSRPAREQMVPWIRLLSIFNWILKITES